MAQRGRRKSGRREGGQELSNVYNRLRLSEVPASAVLVVGVQRQENR